MSTELENLNWLRRKLWYPEINTKYKSLERLYYKNIVQLADNSVTTVWNILNQQTNRQLIKYWR